MREQVLELISRSATTLTLQQVFANFIVALVIGILIFISYRTTYTHVVYSGRFNVSLLMMTLITTLVMSVIGNNVALSLGMVGALSIVRFRTAIKDPRDTAYIFWCIAVGICCGATDYWIAFIGSVFIFAVLVAFGLVQDNQRYLLVVRADSQSEESVTATVDEYFEKKAQLRVNNCTQEKTELIYELSQSIINKYTKDEKITRKLLSIAGVNTANLVCQNDEMK